MSKYPPADSTTQWFQDNFPGATMNLTAKTTVLCLHTTEGASWPTYSGGAIAPTYTAMPRIVKKGLDFRQHFPDEKSARALQNLPGGVETNTLNCIQIELIGTCDPTHKTSWPRVGKAGVDYIFWPDAPAWLLKQLAKFVAYLHKEHGLALTAPVFNPYPASINANRFTGTQWTNFAGICGHQHVPENVHGDPGNLDVPALIGYTKNLLTPPATTVEVPHGVNHIPAGTPEFVGDSHRWLDSLHGGWADLNWIGKWNTHYLYPLLHGFTDPAGKIAAKTPITAMTDAEVKRLEAHWKGDVYSISLMVDQVAYAMDRGIKVEAEEKRRQPQKACQELFDSLDAGHKDDVQVKVGMWLPGKPWTWLEPAHRRFDTIALTHGMRGDDSKKYARLPADAQPYITYYRGWPPVWV